MPHPDRFVVDHAELSEDLGDQVCQRCHSESDCVTCHVKHVHPGGAAEAALETGGGDR
jgi:hypothetical protein